MLRAVVQRIPSYQRSISPRSFFPAPNRAREGPVSTVTVPERSHSSSLARTGINGDIALRCAILYDAVCCFRQQFDATSHQPHRLAKEAEQWLFSNDTQWPFSFVNICAVLGLDPAYLRLRLNRRH
jgi:hypothetical protein